MKKVVWIAALVATTFTSCNGVAGWFGNKEDSTQTGEVAVETIAPQRDFSITEANAYSDLFIDSTALENYIQKENIPTGDAAAMRSFYGVRNYGYAWMASDGLTDEARGFWNLYQSEDDEKDKSLTTKVDTLLQRDSLFIAADDSMAVQTELGLTAAFVKYAAESGNIAGINRNNFYYAVPAKKVDAVQWADSLLNKQKDTAAYSGNGAYAGLKAQLKVYHEAAKDGGWGVIPLGTVLRKGVASPAVTALKKRLAATGDYIATDTSNLFSDSLQAAIRTVQQQHGLAVSGHVNDSLIHALNIPVETRLQQLLVNMNRARWMPAPPNSNYIQVNIPSFMLYAFTGGAKALEMPVVVGKEGASTLMFQGAINQVVFSPYWNIPQSIVESEIMPAMKGDASYLKKRNMEIISKGDSIPTIRQLPCNENALGKVKFLFPNSYDIYLHDTPAKSLFDKSNRALSHGCIRVAKPDSLAAFVLRSQGDWTPQKITTAMNAGKQQEVTVSKPVPVSITYYTAWIDTQGRLNFRDDVYAHDKSSVQKLFTMGG
jgi:murein L,D-transpeptidase YcbB/YkuD